MSRSTDPSALVQEIARAVGHIDAAYEQTRIALGHPLIKRRPVLTVVNGGKQEGRV